MSISRGGDFTHILTPPLSTLLETSFEINDYRLLRPLLGTNADGEYENWRLIIRNSFDQELQFSAQYLKDLDYTEKLDTFTKHVEAELIRREILTIKRLRVTKVREEDEPQIRLLQKPTNRPDA